MTADKTLKYKIHAFQEKAELEAFLKVRVNKLAGELLMIYHTHYDLNENVKGLGSVWKSLVNAIQRQVMTEHREGEKMPLYRISHSLVVLHEVIALWQLHEQPPRYDHYPAKDLTCQTGPKGQWQPKYSSSSTNVKAIDTKKDRKNHHCGQCMGKMHTDYSKVGENHDGNYNGITVHIFQTQLDMVVGTTNTIKASTNLSSSTSIRIIASMDFSLSWQDSLPSMKLQFQN